jgi:hypothetical protein
MSLTPEEIAFLRDVFPGGNSLPNGVTREERRLAEIFAKHSKKQADELERLQRENVEDNLASLKVIEQNNQLLDKLSAYHEVLVETGRMLEEIEDTYKGYPRPGDPFDISTLRMAQVALARIRALDLEKNK